MGLDHDCMWWWAPMILCAKDSSGTRVADSKFLPSGAFVGDPGGKSIMTPSHQMLSLLYSFLTVRQGWGPHGAHDPHHHLACLLASTRCRCWWWWVSHINTAGFVVCSYTKSWTWLYSWSLNLFFTTKIYCARPGSSSRYLPRLTNLLTLWTLDVETSTAFYYFAPLLCGVELLRNRFDVLVSQKFQWRSFVLKHKNITKEGSPWMIYE